MVKREGNRLEVKGQGPGGMEGMGSGERSLLSMFGALGLPPEQVKDWMDNFIPPAKEKE